MPFQSTVAKSLTGVRWSLDGRQFGDFLEQVLVVWDAPRLQFRPNQLILHIHLEGTRRQQIAPDKVDHVQPDERLHLILRDPSAHVLDLWDVYILRDGLSEEDEDQSDEEEVRRERGEQLVHVGRRVNAALDRCLGKVLAQEV